MPKAGRGRGSSSAASKNPRSSSTGRVQKGKQTNAVSAAIAQGSVSAEGIDKKLLHPGYVPRSPVRTRSGTSGATTSGTSTSANIPIRNEFQMLSDDEENNNSDGSSTTDDDDDSRARKKVPTSKKNNSPVERRPPPIFVLDTLADDVDELLEGLGYCLKIGKSAVQVITLTKKNFDLVFEELKRSNFNFYTFNPEKPPVKVVLQGYQDRPISDLKGHLSDAGIKPREIKVLSRKTTVTGTHTLYLLYFDRGTVKIQDLRRTKTLDGFWVNWRFYTKNPTDVAQCHRCQKFGHGSRNCNLRPRCVKCGESHLSEACALPRKADLGDKAEQTKPRVKCANCDGNHTGNYRGCVARKAYLEEQEKRKKKASHPPQRSTSAAVPAAGQRTVPAENSAFPPGWGRSFASVVAAGSGSTAQQEVTGEDLFTLPEFFALAGEMMTRFRSCRNKAEQFLALGELMIKHIYKG